jgi:hypothetical protein
LTRKSTSHRAGGICRRVLLTILLGARRVLGFRVSGYRPDAENYLDGGYNFQALELTSIESRGDEIYTNLEVGLGTGFSMGRPRVRPFSLPRLRVGYRFGDLEGFRIRIGGDWLTTLPEPTK